MNPETQTLRPLGKSPVESVLPMPKDDVYAIIGNMDFKDAELRVLALHTGVDLKTLQVNIHSACAAASASMRELAEAISALSAKMPEIDFDAKFELYREPEETLDILPTDGNLRQLVKLGQKNLDKKVCKR